MKIGKNTVRYSRVFRQWVVKYPTGWYADTCDTLVEALWMALRKKKAH